MAIVSFSHEFIFIKTTKTAGTSMEVHLGAECSEQDIVTPFGRPEPHHHPRNYADGDNILYFNHMPASMIRDLQPRLFENSFKFCFERHPIDKCLSHFAMLINSPMSKNPDTPKSWAEYIDRRYFPLDHPKYLDDHGKLIVDQIYRYEEIDRAVEDIFRRTGIGKGPLLARAKGKFRYGVPLVEDIERNTHQRNLIFDAFSASLKYVAYD